MEISTFLGQNNIRENPWTKKQSVKIRAIRGQENNP
jgi:hypothetical protein